MKTMLSKVFLITFNLFFIYSSLLANINQDKKDIIFEIKSKQDLSNDISKKEVQELVVRYVFLWIDEHKSFPRMQDLKQEIISQKKSESFYKIYISVFNNEYELIKKIIELDTKEQYTKYILMSSIPAAVYKDQILRDKLQDSFVKDYLFPWIDEHKRFILANGENNEDFDFSSTKLYGKGHFMGIFDSYDGIIKKVVALDSEEKYIKYLLVSRLSEDIYKDPIIREKLLKSFVIDYLFPWIDEHKRFPQVEDYRGETTLGMSIYKLSRLMGVDELNDVYPRLIELVVQYDKEEQYLKYISEYVYLPREILRHEHIVEKLRKSLIKDFILPWIDSNERWPEIADFNLGKGGVGVFYYKVFDGWGKEGIFLSLEQMIETMIDMDIDDKYFQYLLESKISSRFYTNQKIRQKLQDVFIERYLFPWIEINQDFSSFEKDFTKDRIGFSFGRIFGYDGGLKLFDSFSDLIRKALEVDKDDRYSKYLLKLSLPQEVYRDQNIRNVLQVQFVKEYIFPWIQKNSKFSVKERNFSIDTIDYARHKIFTKDDVLGIFDSYKDLIEKIVEVDIEEEYVEYIFNFHVPNECYKDENLREKLQDIFIKKYLFPWIETHQRFPEVKDYNPDDGIGFFYSKVFSQSERLGIFDSNKDLLKRLLQLDPEKKYFRYVLKSSKISQECYKNENIRRALQEVFIEEYFRPWIIKYGKMPKYSNFRTNKELGAFTRVFNFNSIGLVGIFEDLEHLQNVYESLYPNDNNDSENLCKNVFGK